MFDEPLGSLDLKLRREMQIEIKNIQRRLDTTFVYVTHDQQEALNMCDLFFFIVVLLPLRGVSAAEDKELNIWTWGIYCPDFATDSFEEEYGIKVNCTFYHGNEELWSKIQAGHTGLDIIQPSNHMIQ